MHKLSGSHPITSQTLSVLLSPVSVNVVVDEICLPKKYLYNTCRSYFIFCHSYHLCCLFRSFLIRSFHTYRLFSIYYKFFMSITRVVYICRYRLLLCSLRLSGLCCCCNFIVSMVTHCLYLSFILDFLYILLSFCFNISLV